MRACSSRARATPVSTLAYAQSYRTPEEVDWSRAGVPIIDLANCDPARIPRGAMSAESGRIAGETLAHMIELALDGRLDGITFAPLNKAALHAGGWHFNDEHQMFAHLTRHQGFFGEMNVLDNLWMSRVTSHVCAAHRARPDHAGAHRRMR